MQEDITRAWIDYWHRFSSMSTWQFWLNIAMVVLPLAILYFVIDRKKALEIGFFGFNVHVWFSYIDAYGITHSLWNYPFHAIPTVPISFELDASLIPVVFMLTYQWVRNHHKNYYLYIIGVSLLLSFVFKPLMAAFDLFQLNKGTTYVHLLVGYVVIALVSKWITNVFLHLHLENQRAEPEEYNLGKLFGRKEKAK